MKSSLYGRFTVLKSTCSERCGSFPTAIDSKIDTETYSHKHTHRKGTKLYLPLLLQIGYTHCTVFTLFLHAFFLSPWCNIFLFQLKTRQHTSKMRTKFCELSTECSARQLTAAPRWLLALARGQKCTVEAKHMLYEPFVRPKFAHSTLLKLLRHKTSTRPVGRVNPGSKQLKNSSERNYSCLIDPHHPHRRMLRWSARDGKIWHTVMDMRAVCAR